MAITRIIFERGLELSHARNSVKLSTNGLSLVQIIAMMRKEYNVRPILLTETINSFGGATRERHGVLTLNGMNQLNVMVTSLQLPQGMKEANYVSLSQHRNHVQYMTGSLVYHCQELALLYSAICDTQFSIGHTLPFQDDSVSLQWQDEPYYEIEALITAARRTYDALRDVLWKVYGPGGPDTPSNFKKTLTTCRKLPDDLKLELENSWKIYGERMTAYRDCIQHYVPVTFGIQTANLERVAGDIWSVKLLLPDNPEGKSQKAFRFKKNLDALTYGWELANEVINVATKIFSRIPTQEEA
jgi:hypothetical protein